MQASSNERPGVDRVTAALLDATRHLLRVTGPSDVRDATVEFVTAVGAKIVDGDDDSAMPVDISYGVGDPIFPGAPVGGDVRRLLEDSLPGFLMDGARALDLVARSSALAEVAAIDPLTGLPNRSMLDRALRRLREDDTIVLIDLDHFERVDGDHGPGSGDEVLRIFGRVLRATSRGRDVVGRYSTEEFVAVLSAGGNATAFLRRLLTEWNAHRPQPISFSAGIVPSAGDTDDTLANVEHAVTLAKEGGSGRWMWVPGGMVPDELGPGPRAVG